MQTILLIIMFLLLMVAFYFIILLNIKISKFDSLGTKQQRMMDEMEDAMAAYLTEMKDENERLIQKLSDKPPRSTETDARQTAMSHRKEQSGEQPAKNVFDMKTHRVPVKVALQSYKSAEQKEQSAEPPHAEKEPADDRTRALRYADEGKSVEEIARILGKGKTEIELLLKFR